MNKKIFSLMLLCGVMTLGCTDLEEEVLDESLSPQIPEAELAAGWLAPTYSPMPDLFLHTNYFNLQEVSTDEAILPYRGGTDWGDNGIHIDMHRHNYGPTHVRIADAWNSISLGLSRTIAASLNLSELTSEEAKQYLPEARGMKGYYSMLSLDLFGLVMHKENLNSLSTVLRGNDAIEQIKSDLLFAAEGLGNSNSTGRMSQAAAWGLLARLHLNAAAYRDIYAPSYNFTNEDMQKVVEYCDKVIALGKYSISPEYFEIFDDENNTNKEIIFAYEQRADLNGHNRMAYFSLSGDQFPLPQFPNANGTDGPGITPEFYRAWVNAFGGEDKVTNDPRFFKENMLSQDGCVAAANFEINRGILRGQQYGLLTDKKGDPFKRCGDGTYQIGKLYNITRANKSLPVLFTEAIDFNTNSGYSSGFRVSKYEFSKKSDTGRNKGEADIVLLRLADIYLMRAEAKLRMNDAAGALTDINFVRAGRTARQVAPALSVADVTLDNILRERGFEFYWEMQRRTDLIRFGKYEDSWTEKTDKNVNKRLFPIPQTAIDGASVTPGFLLQNQGY